MEMLGSAGVTWLALPSGIRLVGEKGIALWPYELTAKKLLLNFESIQLSQRELYLGEKRHRKHSI
jgi:hypothetical protein